MNIAFNRSDDHLAERFHTGFSEQRTQYAHAAFHRVSGEQHFGNEQDAVAEVDADDAHALDQRLVQDLVGGPAAIEQDLGTFDDLFFHPVIKVIVHLLDKLVSGQVGKDDILFVVVVLPVLQFFVGHISNPCPRIPPCGVR